MEMSEPISLVPMAESWGRSRYNDFQQTMLQWNRMHPYNAVHVIKVGGAICPSLYQERINHVISNCGLGQLIIDEERGTYCFSGGNPGCVPQVIEGGIEPQASIYREMERQVNESFPIDRSFTPFRFFILPSGDVTFLGIAYFHAIADADSIGRLLIEITRSCFDPVPGPIRDETLHPGRESRVPLGNPIAATRRFIEAFKKFQRLRLSFRPPVGVTCGSQNAFFGLSLDQGATATVLATARRWQVTVNDLFLAALLQAVASLTSDRFENKRKYLSVGCVVNLRRDVEARRQRDFGLFLGSFPVTHPVPEGISLHDLATEVRSQTLMIKRRKLYLAARIEFRVSRWVFARIKPEKRHLFYRRVYPIWGSITNVRVDSLCAEHGFVPVLDYYRAVSAGPAMPFVVSITGFGGRLNFGVSYRAEVIPHDKIDLIMGRFVELLTKTESEV